MEKVELGRVIDHFRTALTLKDQETQERISKTLEETEALLAQIGFPCTVDDARTQLRKSGERVLDLVKADGNLTKNQEEQGLSPLEVIQRTLRLIHEGLGFDRTILCLPQGSSALVAIVGVGRNANAIVPKFRCFSAQPDLLRIGLAKKMDLAIADTQNPNYAKLLPPWYREIVNARSFVTLPLLHEEQTLGMIYGDYSEALTQSPLAAHSEKLAVWRQQLIQALLAGAVKH